MDGRLIPCLGEAAFPRTLMNIFVLDTDITRCARYHCDQHVSKMILESAQMLCTALNEKGMETPYRSTHARHPCTLWVGESYDNFRWLCDLAAALNAEFRYRFERRDDHKSMAVVEKVSAMEFASLGLTPFAQAMPDQYKVAGNAVAAYRNFYIGEKLGFAKWTKRKPPHWVRAALGDKK